MGPSLFSIWGHWNLEKLNIFEFYYMEQKAETRLKPIYVDWKLIIITTLLSLLNRDDLNKSWMCFHWSGSKKHHISLFL